MKKGILVFLLAVLISTVLFAAKETVFWHTLPRDPDKSSIEEIVKQFEKENPDIKVKIVVVPAGETDSSKILTAVAGGTAPDLFYVDRFTVPQRAAQGVN